MFFLSSTRYGASIQGLRVEVNHPQNYAIRISPSVVSLNWPFTGGGFNRKVRCGRNGFISFIVPVACCSKCCWYTEDSVKPESWLDLSKRAEVELRETEHRAHGVLGPSPAPHMHTGHMQSGNCSRYIPFESQPTF